MSKLRLYGDTSGYIDVAAPATADNSTLDLSTVVKEDANGNVGIGTSSPDSLLHIETVSGTAQIKLRKTVSGTSTIKVEDSGFLNINNASAAGILLGTSNTTRMSIDSSGHVTMPNQPAFRAHLSSSYSHPAGTQLIPFDQTSFNIGNHYNTSTHRFTAPVTGLYQLSAVISVSNGQAIAYWGCRFRVNGSTDWSLGWNAQSSGYQREDFVTLIYLTANDYVEARHEMQTAATVDAGFGYTHFAGYLVG